MKKLTLLITSLVVLFGISIQAQVVAPTSTPANQTFLVADGSSSGTYQQFLKEIVIATSDSGIVFQEVPSSGAIENLDKLVNNKVMGAFMHSDVIYFRAQAEKLDNFKTLVALFDEDVHFVALTTSKKSIGGVLGYGSKPVVFTTISDLQGYKVGAAGGGYITAQVIRSQSAINYEIKSFASGKDVLAALTDGTIDAAVFVGASPLPNLETLDSTYKILSIPTTVQDRLRLIYKPTTVTYTKMSPNSISTVAAQCLFVTKTYKSKKMVEQLAKFRQSLFDNLDTLKETPGNHPKWQQVSPDNRGHWSYLDLPTYKNGVLGAMPIPRTDPNAIPE